MCYTFAGTIPVNLSITSTRNEFCFKVEVGGAITHSHSASVFYWRRRKSMKKAKIRPLATPKSLNRSSQKLAGMITSWTAPDMQNVVAIGSGVSAPQIRDFAVPLGWLVSSFFGFFNKAIAYIHKRIFTQNSSKGKEVPFGGPNYYI